MDTRSNANQSIRLNTLQTQAGLRIKCDKSAQVPYIMCESEAGEPRFSVESDGTVLTHAIYDNNHENLPDNLVQAIATGNDSVYIGQAKVSYSDSAGFKFYKLKDNTVPTVLAAAPFSLTTSQIDAGKNNNTLLRWLDLARPSHSSSNLRINDIVPLSNLAADFDEVTIGGGGGSSTAYTRKYKIWDDNDWGAYNSSSNRLQITVAMLNEHGWDWAYSGNSTIYLTLPEYTDDEKGLEFRLFNMTSKSLKIQAFGVGAQVSGADYVRKYKVNQSTIINFWTEHNLGSSYPIHNAIYLGTISGTKTICVRDIDVYP